MIADGLPQRISDAITSSGMSRAELARALDAACTTTTIRRWIAPDAERPPSIYYAARLCAVCGLSLDWLLYGNTRGEAGAPKVTADRATGESLAQRIRNRREALGMSQEELAREIGASGQPMICYWEQGMCQPSLYFLEKLCRALKISADELVRPWEDHRT